MNVNGFLRNKLDADRNLSFSGILRIAFLLLVVLVYGTDESSADLVVISSNTTISASDLSYDNLSITIDACTVTINGAHQFESLSLVNGAKLTHSSNSSSQNNILNLTITNDLSIDGTSLIDVNGRGYTSQNGPGKGASAYNSGGGAGHGGNGGKGYEGSGGGSYDSAADPTQIGSGGGRATRYNTAGGKGGGGIRLSAGGVITNDGVIRANGYNGSSYNNRSSGGGSGGFINLTAGEFTGSGVISANGGNAVSTSYAGGGGAGGRIAIKYNINNYTGSVSAYGGTGKQVGAAGSIYFKSNTSTEGRVIYDNNGNSGATTYASETLLPDVVIRNKAVVVAVNELTAKDCTIDNADFYANYKSALENLVIKSGGYLRHSSNSSSQTYIVDMDVTGSITVEAGGYIDVNGRGYASQNGPSKGGDGWNSGGGAGHGGNGGTGYEGSGGGTYDSAANPTLIGSGGGRADKYGTAGGKGGGGIRLSAGGVFANNGVIRAIGNNGSSYNNRSSGGGSGGFINLTAGEFAGSGVISANGGNAVSTSYAGGGGAGGRIAIKYDINNYTGSVSAYGGTGKQVGAAGSIYFKSNTSAEGRAIYDNNGKSGASTYVSETLLPDVVIRNKAIVVTANELNAEDCTIDNATFYANYKSALENLVIKSGGILRHSSNSSSQTYIIDMDVTGSITVETGGYIDANGRGYAGHQGPGRGADGYNSGGGAGHGGNGGTGYNGSGGGTYDSAANPTQIGSGGGRATRYGTEGAKGGGGIRLSAGGVFANDGVIRANGYNGSSSYSRSSGGGSGGFINLTAGEFTGSGVISANGGNAVSTTYTGGGGAGGRVAIYCEDRNYTGTVTAYGGTGKQTGAAGSIYVKATAQGLEEVVYDNNGKSGASTTVSGTLPDVFIQNKAVVIAANELTLLNCTVDNAYFYADYKSTLENLIIKSDSFLRHSSNSSLQTYIIDMDVTGNITIETGSYIDANGRGYASQKGSGKGADGYNSGGGAGHGGNGGNGYNGSGGSTYDSAANPSQIGSGGGRATKYGTAGGKGGGGIRLSAGGVLTIDGVIRANGYSGSSKYSRSSGAGSGGFVNITAGELTGSGVISAIGGNAASTTYTGGGGAGGRIAIKYNTNTYAGSFSAYGGSGNQDGAAGSIYLKSNAPAEGRVIYDNNGKSGASTYVSGTLPDVFIRNKAVVVTANDLTAEDCTIDNAYLYTNKKSALDNLVIKSGGFLRHGSNSSSQTYIIDLDISGSVTVETGGYIDANGRGYASRNGPGKGGDGYNSGGGAGYGGKGGSGYNGSGGGTYDSTVNPTQIGSGGGRATKYGTAGGKGGGGIRVSSGGFFTNNGVIRANGSNGSVNYSRSGGGGSGGFINITAGEFAGSGVISANGGNAVSTTYTGGGGGGGRIALYYATKSPAETYNLANISVAGGTGKNNGQNGTLYIPEVGNPVITTNNGIEFTTDTADIILEGTCLADAFWILINGSSDGVIHAPGESTWSYPVSLQEGINSFEVVAQNALGEQSGTVSITIILDTTPAGAPVITTNTGGNFTVQNHLAVFQGSCSADTVQILVNGSSSGVSYTPGSTTWSYEGELAVGVNTFSVVAIDAAGNESPADTITIDFENTIPDRPSNQSPTDAGIDIEPQAVLTASAFSDLDSDSHISSQWQIRTANGAYDTPVFDSGEDNQQLIQLTVPKGILGWTTQFFWKVRYRDGRGSWSEFSVETSFTTISDNEPPEDIVNLTAVESTETGLNFSWGPSANTAGDLKNYKVYFNGDTDGSLLPPDQSDYIITDLTPATGYTFKVTALDESGNESDGVSIEAATLLENPLNLAARAGSTWVDLTWDAADPANLVEHYVVYQSTADFTSVEGLTPEAVSGTTAIMTGLTPGIPYYFAVTTVNISGGEKTDVTAITATPSLRQVTHYTMDGIDDGTLVDETGLHDGTVYGNTHPVAGYVDQALSFDGSGDWVGVDSLQNEIKNGDDVSISFWFKTTAKKSSDHHNVIFSAHTGSKSNCFRIGTGNSGGIFHSVYTEDSEYGNGYNNGIWHHLVVIQYGSGAFKIYVDNKQIKSATKSVTPWSTAVYYSIAQEWDTNPTDFFTGQIDQFQLYNYALSMAQIADLYVDMTPPALVGTNPSDGSQVQPVNQITYTLSDRYGTVDDDATAGSVLVKDALDQVIEGTVTEANDQFTFTPNMLPLDDGLYTVAFTAVDQDANTAEYGFSFTVDSQPPALPTITGGMVYSGVIQVQPAVNRSNAATITLTGTREDNTSVWVNGTRQVTIGTGDWSMALDLNQGDITLTITLQDTAGNESNAATVQVLVDSIAPAVTSVTPADNGLLNTVPESISIDYTEATSGLNMTNTILTIRDAGYQVVPGQWENLDGSRLVFTPLAPFADSAYTVNIQLEDNLANQGPALTYRFELDTLPPAAPVVTSVVSPTHNPTQTIIGTKAAGASILLDGQVIIASTPATSWAHTVALSSGSNLFVFTAMDPAGNSSLPTEVVIVFDDLSPPAVAALLLDEEGDGTTVALDWSGYDESANSDVDFYEIYVETAPFTDVGGLTAKDTLPAGQFAYMAGGLSRDTTYYFAVVAVDLAGNFLTAVTPVAGTPVDIVPPEEVTGLDVERTETELIFSWEPSADSDGDLAGYIVYFDGDATGVSLDPSVNSYTKADLTPATAYPFRVTAVDNDGNESDGAELAAATLMAKPAGVVGERGVIAELTHDQQTVLLPVAYQNPVVFAQMVSTNGNDPAIVRIVDVRSDRFTVKIQEVPGTTDGGVHAAETVSYFVFEAGDWQLPGGGLLKVGTLNTAVTVGAQLSADFEPVEPAAPYFTDVPVVISQIQTNKDPHWVKTRLQNISPTGFAVALEEEEAKTTPHAAAETIGWLAIEPGSGDLDGLAYRADLTLAVVDENWHEITFSGFNTTPGFLAAVQTYNGTDNAGLRTRNLTHFIAEVRVEEDTTRDTETAHSEEVVGYFLMEGEGLLTLAEFEDVQPPELVAVEPADGSIVSAADQIVITLFDRHGSLDYAAVKGSIEVLDDLDRPVAGSVTEADDQFIFTPDSLALPDGLYTVSLTAADMAGNTTPYSTSFTLDSLAPAKPVVTGGTVVSGIIQPHPVVNRSDDDVVTLTGTREAGSVIRINGADVDTGSTEDWSVTLTLAQGDNGLEIMAVDAAGNTSPLEFVQIYVDSVAPAVTGILPADGSFLGTPPAQVTIVMVEATSGLDYGATATSIADGAGTTVDGEWLPIDTGIAFVPYETMGDAVYTVIIQPADSLGNRSEPQTFTFTVDRLPPPAPVITGPTLAGGVVQPAPAVNASNTTALPLTGTREDGTSVWIDGQLAVAAGTGDWSKNLTLIQGLNTLTITLEDQAGNQSEPATISVLVDSFAPVVTGITPADNSILPLKPANVTVDFNETNSGLDLTGSTHILRDNSFTTVPGEWTVSGGDQLVFTPGNPLPESIYTVTLQLRDTFGNQGQVHQYRFTVDTIAPAAPVVNPVASPTVNPTQTISGTREAFAAILMNGEQIQNNAAGTAWEQTVSLASGTNRFTFEARDRAGNLSDPVSVEIVYDDVVPLPVTTLTVDGQGDGSRVTLNWTYNEAEHGDIAAYTIYRKDTAFADVTEQGVAVIGSTAAGTFSFGVDGLSAGTTTWFAVVAVDLTGNFRTDVTAVPGSPVDNAPPDNVGDFTVQPFTDRLIFDWSASPSTDLAGYRICFHTDPCTLVEGPDPATRFEKTGLAPAAAYPLTVYARDAQGNESSGAGITGYTLLANPTGLATQSHSGKVDLTWLPSEPAAYVKHYKVYVSLDPFSTVAGRIASVTTTGTGAQVAGLTNNTAYHFAVTAVNLSGGEAKAVASISATPEPDSQGPQITNIKIGSEPLTQDYKLEGSATVSLTATDSVGVSRVEFSVDGNLTCTDTSGSTYTCHIDIMDMADGGHSLTIAAFDTLGNITLAEYIFEVALAPPAAPVITRPANGATVNQAAVTVEGSAEKLARITLYNNAAVVAENVAVDAQGNFSASINLAEGQNMLEAAATNRTNTTGDISAPVQVTLNTAVPSAPTGLTAQSRSGGTVRLTWQAPDQADIDGYRLYRSDQPFDTIGAAARVNSSLVGSTTYDNLPPDDGTWHYRVTAVNAAGNESALSGAIQAVSDSVGPRAVSIRYTPQGNVEPVSGAMAPGRVDIVLTVSEPLQTTPFLTLTPEGGTPISIDLTKASDLTYTSFFSITAATPTARAWAVFSARDIAGNRGTTIDEGQSIRIDTDGPAASRLVVLPLSPIQNDVQDPATLLVTIGLSEKSKPGSIALSYLLSGPERQAVAVDTLTQVETQSGDAETWQASVDLPADAGLDELETLTFAYTGEDDLGNISHEIAGDNRFQVYQGDLPPLAVPTGLTGQALPGGNIRLSWNAVEGAVAYQLYRQSPNESELTAHARIEGGVEFNDAPLQDGLYTYAIASIRAINDQESVSGQSAAVSVPSDATAPPPPANLVLDLIPQGIRANWTASAAADPVTYAFYRAATDTTAPADATLVQDGFSQTSWIDFNPSGSEHYYMVTASDEVGNESAPCPAAYLDFALLPVSGITVVQQDFSLPQITWTHPEAGAVDGYDLYLGPAAAGVKLNGSLLTARSFTDVGYAGDTRTYTLVAVSDNNDSLPRSLTLPQVSAWLDEGMRIKRGIMNRLDFEVENSSTQAVEGIYLKVNVDGRSHTSGRFNLTAGESSIVPIVVGGYDDLPDVADMTVTVEVRPNTGETVKIVRSGFIEVDDGMLVLRIFNEEFTRGAGGKVGFSLENTGDETIEIQTARKSNKSASSQVTFYLKDKDGNTLSTAAFKQTIGNEIVGLSNGNTVARIPAGETFTSDLITMDVPPNAPDSVYIQLSIARIYHQGQTDQVVMNGLSTTHDIFLIDTSYYGQVDAISPETSSGNQDIVISGQAVARGNGYALPNVPLNLVVSVDGFERSYKVYTDQAGLFSHAFKPLKNEAGRYTVRAVHPDLRNRPVHGRFTISRVSVSPARVNLSLSRNYKKSVNIKVATSKGTALSNVRLVYDEADQPGGEYPQGVTLKPGGSKSVGSGGSVYLPFTIWADNTAAATASLKLRVVSGTDVTTEHGTVNIDAGFYTASPVLNFTPTNVVTGVAWDDTVVETVKLKNSGLGDLNNVRLSLHKLNGSPAPAWIYLTSAANQGVIAAGASRKVNIAFSPTEEQAGEGDHSLYLKVDSANYADKKIYLSAAVTQSGQGDVQFKISDIYTGTNNAADQLIEGLKGAKIKLQNETVTTFIRIKTTDDIGEALFSDLPAGRYTYRITAKNHIEQTGRLWVKPGVTVSEDVFLDYNVVTVEWSVTETTIEDKYEITLNTTFETNVPVAVVVIKPASVTLPAMQAGDVFNGEFTLTNHGLIRADDISIRLPESDRNFKYEILGGVPESIAAKEKITVPYRITCLQSLEPTGEGTGGGCRSYQACATVSYGSICANGQYVPNTGRTCFTRVYGCTSGGSAPVIVAGGGTANVSGVGGGRGSTSKPAPAPRTVKGVKCFPKPERKEGFCAPCYIKGVVSNIFQNVLSSVNMVMREYHREDVDLSVKVPGGSITAKRWYFGGRWRWEALRHNLSFNYDSLGEKIDSIDKGGVSYEAAAGQSDLFTHEFYRIRRTDTGWRWEHKNGEYRLYDAAGRTTEYGGRTGAIGKLIYDPADNGKLVGIADREGTQVLWYEYDDNDRLSAVRDAAERRVAYGYTSGRLTSVTDVLQNTTRFEYDSKGLINKVIDPENHAATITYDTYGHISAVLDQKGNGHRFEYDYYEGTRESYVRISATAGPVREVWYDRYGDPIRVDINGRTVQKIARDGRHQIITDEHGRTTRKEYDEWDNLTKVIHPDGTSVSYEYEHVHNRRIREIDENLVETTYTYDAAGNLTRKVEAAGTDDERITVYTYDSDGDLRTVKRLADAQTVETLTRMTYDGLGNLTSVTDPEDGVTRFTSHDAMGKVLTKEDARGKLWQYAYDAAGRLETVTDPLIHVTRYTYDKKGNRTGVMDPENRQTTYDYDQRGNLVKQTDHLGNETLFEYNADGKLLRQTDPELKVIRYEYDDDGRLIKTIDGNDNEIRMEYDEDIGGAGCTSCGGAAGDQPGRIVYPTFVKEFVYDDRGRKTAEKDLLGTETLLTAFDYDDAGNLVARTDKENRITGYDYDNLNRLVIVTDAASGETGYVYDNRDNLLALTDAEKQTTRFEYDRNNRLVKEIRPGLQETSYDYDDAGNLVQKLDAKNQKTEYEYDDAGRLKHIRYFATTGDTTAAKTVTFNYDAAGHLTGYDDGTTSATYSYDELHRKETETVNYGPFQLTNVYSYYTNGLKKTFTGPDNVTYTYTYDAANQLSGVQIPNLGQITYSAYKWNRPEEIILPGGSRRTFEYDPLMRVKQITATDPGQNVIMGYNYSYDRMDNITAKATEHGNYDYGYDDLYRLTDVDNPIQTDETYTYDDVGNRLTSAEHTDWKYSDNNELQGYDGVTFAYDANGNTVEKNDNGAITKYIYNIEDRLVRVEDGTGAVIGEYYYDPFGRRIWKDVDGERAYFVYSDEGLIGEYKESGNEIKSYGYKPGSIWTTDPVFMKIEGQYYFYHNDHLGTPQKLTAVNGSVVWSAKYSSFGKADVELFSTIKNNLRLAGQYFDQETEMHYNCWRYYDKNIGRYLRIDPISIKGGNNLYRYVSNKPIRYIDPFGLKKECAYCPDGKWDVDIHGNANLVILIGGNRSRVTFTCLSNKKKCTGVLDCAIFGIGADASLGYSFEFHGERGDPVGTGTIIKGYYSEESIEYYTSSSWVIAAGPVGTSGNNINVTIGVSLFVGKQFCSTKYIVCD